MASSIPGPSSQIPNSAQSRSPPIITQSITGATPGCLDPSQPSRLLRHSNHKLSFASFDDQFTATTSSDISDLHKTFCHNELFRQQRVVIETTADGESFWRFVPNAKREDGCVHEGAWPRVLEICGKLIECSLEQWELYKLDPQYECLVRMPPNRSSISRVCAPQDDQQGPRPIAQSPLQLLLPEIPTCPTLKPPGICESPAANISSSSTNASGNGQMKGEDKTQDEIDCPRTTMGHQAEPTPASTHDSRCHWHLPTDGLCVWASCLYLIFCIIVACWMRYSGPKLVPRQDTRITNTILSVASKLAQGLALWIVTLTLRAQWAALLVAKQPVPLSGLLAACGGEGSLSRVLHIRTAPTVRLVFTAILGAAVTLLMTLTSAGFKYIVVPGTAMQEFSGPDFLAICDHSLVNASTGYFCRGRTNAITVTEWSFLDVVNSGAGGNVLMTGGHTGTLSANVTLTSAPADLRLPTNAPPPWAAIDVGCRAADLVLELVGNGSTSSNTVFVDGRALDKLTIAEMPSWGSQVQLYQQVNDSEGPASSLAPWYMVLLARELGDGTANIVGLSGAAVKNLGNSFADLHGIGSALQGILGAAAYCNFSGSTGGNWPSGPWPSVATTNVVVGTQPYNGTIDLSTVFLNYGPSWQFNPVSANSLPGGSVSYIANWTGQADNFADYIAMYMRNQWVLMMYANNFIVGYVTNTTYDVRTQPQLHMEATVVLLLPGLVLAAVSVYCAVGVWTMLGLGTRYERVDVAPWWLLEATGATSLLEGCHASKPEFKTWCSQVTCIYSDASPGRRPTLESTTHHPEGEGEERINAEMQ